MCTIEKNFRADLINISSGFIYGVGLSTASLIAFLMLVLFYLCNKSFDFWISDNYLTEVSTVLACVFFMFFHAFIHCLVWSKFCLKNFKAMELNFEKNSIIFKCRCRKILTTNHYIFGKIMPLIIMGILLGIISTIICCGYLLFISIFLTLTCYKDISYVIKLMIYKNKINWVIESQDKHGIIIYTENK